MEERIFGLDVVRATAIILVVIHHGFEIWAFPFPLLPDGVDIFFVLSGFLIGRILTKIATATYGASLHDIKIFLLRRWLRTLPAMWFALAINLGITFYFDYRSMSARTIVRGMLFKDHIWEYVFFLQNLTTNLRSTFFPESWSLSVEEWFYLVFPILLFLLQYSKLSRKLVLLSVIFIMIITPFIARFYLSNIHSRGDWMLTRMIVVMRLDSIGFGVLLAYVATFAPTLWKRWQRSRFLLIAGSVSFYIIFWIVCNGGLYLGSVTLTNMLFFPLSSACVMLALPCMITWNISSGLVKKGVTFISKISYSMYLVNYSIVIRLIKATATGSEAYGPALYVVYWMMTITMSVLMYHYIEKPFLTIRDKYFKDESMKTAERKFVLLRSCEQTR